MIRSRIFTAALAGIAALAGGTALAAAPFVPLTQQTAGALKYAGSINHTGTGHTYLATTLGQCQTMVQQSKQQHLSGTHPNCTVRTWTEVPCQKRGFFELSAPSGGGTDGVTTVMVHLPTAIVRELGDLRERYHIDAYEADIGKLVED